MKRIALAAAAFAAPMAQARITGSMPGTPSSCTWATASPGVLRRGVPAMVERADAPDLIRYGGRVVHAQAEFANLVRP